MLPFPDGVAKRAADRAAVSQDTPSEPFSPLGQRHEVVEEVERTAGPACVVCRIGHDADVRFGASVSAQDSR
jgi:hypothetical protein